MAIIYENESISNYSIYYISNFLREFICSIICPFLRHIICVRDTITVTFLKGSDNKNRYIQRSRPKDEKL